jgi:tripeptide aminopeptidase
MADLIAELAALPLAENPKTTLNVGTVEGGTSVNTIAAEASFVLDLRSTDAAALSALGDLVESAARRAGRGVIRVETDLLGARPAGAVPTDSPLVRAATATLAALGLTPICDASSTDANVPIGRGVPAVCIGLTTGGNVHRVDEYIETEPVATGLAQLAILALETAEAVADGRLLAPALLAR